MSEHYESGDFDRAGEVGEHHPALFKKFIDWSAASL